MERVKEILSSPVFISIVIILVGIAAMGVFVLSTNNQKKSEQLPYVEYAQIGGKTIVDNKIVGDPTLTPAPDGSIPTIVPIEAPQVKVVIEEYGDFQCPACGTLYKTQLFDQVQQKYGSNVKFVFKNYPLANIHPFAFRSAEAVLAAGAQGKYWEMYNIIYQKQDSFGNPATGPNVEDLIAMAKEIKVADVPKLEKEIKNDFYRDAVRKDIDSGNRLGVTSTPTIFINGEKYKGNWSIEEISPLIDKILSN